MLEVDRSDEVEQVRSVRKNTRKLAKIWDGIRSQTLATTTMAEETTEMTMEAMAVVTAQVLVLPMRTEHVALRPRSKVTFSQTSRAPLRLIF